MFDIWKNLKELVRVNYRHVRTTNLVFTLHTKVTVVILVGLSILVTSRQYLGKLMGTTNVFRMKCLTFLMNFRRSDRLHIFGRHKKCEV